jgi:Fe-S-cluster containining protein
MSAQVQGSTESVTGDVELSAGGWQLRARVTVPAGPSSLRVMLPVIRLLADGIVNLGERAVEEKGRTVSCKKGCGACCRQLVPISEVEARQIRELVEHLPEPRRSEVRARFADARRRLQESGMQDKLEHRPEWTDEEFRRIGLDYFYLGIPCPFLEDESCSIHPERPITCREYLVTSPAENCARPTAENIECVPLPAKLWTALARFDPMPPDSRYLRWVPLILAPEWAEDHPEELPDRPGPEWLRAVLEHVKPGGGAPPSPEPGAGPVPGPPAKEPMSPGRVGP